MIIPIRRRGSRPAGIVVALALALTASSAPDVASAEAISPAALTNAGWLCFVPSVGGEILCANPGLGRPPIPPVADGRPSYMFLRFDLAGNLAGTSHLIRADVYRGQPCAATGGSYAFIARIGYYSCDR